MPRPLDPDRLHRLGLARTGDAVADRMLDVAATEIEAGNAGANELGILSDMFKGIFDSAANGIQRASSSAGDSAQFMESVDKVIGLMASNLASSAIRELRSLTQEARPGMAVGEGAMLGNILDARRKAWNKLTELAGNGRPWDIKRQFPEWSFDPVSNRSFFRDIWGNVHFGYLGLAAGFSEVELFSGAGANQFATHDKRLTDFNNLREFGTIGLGVYDDPKDIEAIKIGMNIWKTQGASFSTEHLVGQLRASASSLNTR